jgi:hypothetical protein
MSYSIQKHNTNVTSPKKQQTDFSEVFGYDVSLITKDLQRTIIVSFLLIGVLVFLAWYLPIGVLSS